VIIVLLLAVIAVATWFVLKGLREKNDGLEVEQYAVVSGNDRLDSLHLSTLSGISDTFSTPSNKMTIKKKTQIKNDD
jgi:hypothetical protein